MSEGLVEVSAMVNHVYQLENSEYIGLKEQLQELNIVLKKKSNIRGCSMPKAGESLKNGNFLPKLEENVTTQVKQTSTLYTETYICGHLHSHRKKKATIRRIGWTCSTLWIHCKGSCLKTKPRDLYFDISCRA